MAEIKEYSLIKDGRVMNRIVADEKFIESVRADYDLVTDDKNAVMGATWDGKGYTPPAPQDAPKSIESKLDALIKKVEALSAVKEGATK